MNKKLMTHKEANYRIAQSGDKRCGVCTMFRYGKTTHSCTLVMDPIRANFVCDFFSKREKREPPHAT